MVKTGEWISKGWQLAIRREYFWSFVLLSLLYLAAYSVISSTYVGALLLFGPITCSYYAVVLHVMRTGKFDFNRIGDGFQVFLPAMLAGLITSLFISIGLMLCIIPGIVLTAMYLFPFLLVLDRKMEFWEAMEESRKKVQEDLLGFIGFVLVQIGVVLLGLLACGVGVIVAVAVVFCADVVAYRDLWPEDETKVIAPSAPEPTEPAASQ